jgi:hypothetical protein
MSKKSRGLTKLTFYEQVGIIIPGSVLLFGSLFFQPDMRSLLTKDGVSVGQLGIFVLLSYAAGHLMAAVGNGIEWLFWKPFGGMPSDWVIKPEQTLLAAAQMTNLEERVRTLLGIDFEKIAGMTTSEWRPISKQIYARLMKDGQTGRIDTFNGNYGLNRGLTSAMLMMAVLSLTHEMWGPALGVFAVACVFLCRMYRFGVHYGHELYMQFLVISEQPQPPRAAARRKPKVVE